MAKMTKQEKQERKELAVEALRLLLARDGISKGRDGKPIIYTILRSVSRSGMTRIITAVAMVDGIPYYLDYYASAVLDMPLSQMAGGAAGVKVGGCGMDMGFHLVYSLAFALYGDGYALERQWL